MRIAFDRVSLGNSRLLMAMVGAVFGTILLTGCVDGTLGWRTSANFEGPGDGTGTGPRSAFGLSVVTSPDPSDGFALTLGATASSGVATRRWLVQRSLDGGSTWTNSDEYQAPTGEWSNAVTGAILKDGSAVVIGYRVIPSAKPLSTVVVRRTKDRGRTWTTVSEHVETEFWMGGMLTSDQRGRLYYLLAAGPSFGKTGAVVRESSDGGKTWTEIDRIKSNLKDVIPANIVAHPRLGVVYAAQVYGDDKVYHWVVRGLARGATAWQTLDDYNVEPGKTAVVSALGVSPKGELITSGRVRGLDGKIHWLTRLSADGGKTWTNSDDFVLDKGGLVWGAIASKYSGLYVAGKLGPVWAVRRSVDGGKTWTTSDSFEFSVAGDSEARGIAESRGQIIVVGYGHAAKITNPDPAENATWLVRTGEWSFSNAALRLADAADRR